MSLDKPDERVLLDQLSRLQPPTATVDPRVAFYEMGYAVALSSSDMPEQKKRGTAGWLATVATIAACIPAAFVAGYVIRPTASPTRSSVAEVRVDHSGIVADRSVSNMEDRGASRTEDRGAGNAEERGASSNEDRGAIRDTHRPTGFTTPGSSPRTRAEILSTGLQDSWEQRELNAYGFSSVVPVNRNGTANTNNPETLVSTLTRMDYLTWEDSQ